MRERLDNLTQTAGYSKGIVTMYTFRRGFGNSIDSKCNLRTVSTSRGISVYIDIENVIVAERTQALGH